MQSSTKIHFVNRCGWSFWNPHLLRCKVSLISFRNGIKRENFKIVWRKLLWYHFQSPVSIYIYLYIYIYEIAGDQNQVKTSSFGLTCMVAKEQEKESRKKFTLGYDPGNKCQWLMALFWPKERKQICNSGVIHLKEVRKLTNWTPPKDFLKRIQKSLKSFFPISCLGGTLFMGKCAVHAQAWPELRVAWPRFAKRHHRSLNIFNRKKVKNLCKLGNEMLQKRAVAAMLQTLLIWLNCLKCLRATDCAGVALSSFPDGRIQTKGRNAVEIFHSGQSWSLKK